MEKCSKAVQVLCALTNFMLENMNPDPLYPGNPNYVNQNGAAVNTYYDEAEANDRRPIREILVEKFF